MLLDYCDTFLWFSNIFDKVFYCKLLLFKYQTVGKPQQQNFNKLIEMIIFFHFHWKTPCDSSNRSSHNSFILRFVRDFYNCPGWDTCRKVMAYPYLFFSPAPLQFCPYSFLLFCSFQHVFIILYPLQFGCCCQFSRLLVCYWFL